MAQMTAWAVRAAKAAGAIAALVVVAALGVAVAGGCRGPAPGGPASPSPSGVPPRPADITGVVRELNASGDASSDAAAAGGDVVLLVVADSGATGSIDRASVRVPSEAGVWAAGERVTTARLARGQQVAVWFSGPVAESYPVQATAGAVEILAPLE